MSPSRRQFIGALGTAVAVSGCSGRESSTEGEPETVSDQSVSTVIRARLLGPETDQLLFDGSDIVRVGEVAVTSGRVQLPLQLSDAATASMGEQFREANVSANPGNFEIQLLDEDGEINRFGITPDLARSIQQGEWNGEFVLTLEDRGAAEETRAKLLGNDTETPAQ